MPAFDSAEAELGCGGCGDSTLLEIDPPRHTRRASRSLQPGHRSPGRSSLRLAASRLRAARGELLQQRGEFSLNFDHPVCLAQVSLQARVLTPQPRQLLLAGVACRPPRGCGQRLQGALVTLLAPLRDQRGVQPLASQECASLVAGPPFILSEYPQLV